MANLTLMPDYGHVEEKQGSHAVVPAHESHASDIGHEDA
jgi:hypothetical protein